MFWKIKGMLTDKYDRPFMQYFDENAKEFKVQPEIATEKTLKTLTNSLVSAANTVEPPHLRNVRLVESDIYFVHWFHDGLFYGSSTTDVMTIHTSADGETWEVLATLPRSTGNSITAIIVSDTNRIIVATFNGEVFVSDEDGVFGSEPTFVSGKFDNRFGHFKYRNIIGLVSYENHGFDDGQKHEAFLSVDNGATFNKVFDISTLDTLPPLADDRYHLHDMEYDPYSGRLYLWSGDFENRTLNYSDDWGVTWKTAFPRGQIKNATQVIATKDGIALGADSAPAGMDFINVDRTKNTSPNIDISDYDMNHWVFSDEGERVISTRRWVERDKGIYLVPFIVEYDDNQERSASLAFSSDGYNWHEIFKSPSKGHYSGIWSVTYGNGKIVGTHRNTEGNYQTFIAECDLG